MTTRFEHLGLSKEILRAIESMGFEEATPIQTGAIPRLLEGRHVIGQAQTGTGKTAAFGIPLLEKADASRKTTQGLVLCPTRELAIQVATELGNLAAYKKHLIVLPVYGGQPIERQFRALAKGAHIVVGTPGRVLDHLERGTLKLDDVNMAILDEADEMLDMGFRDDIEAILEQTPQECQNILFSATMPAEILALAKRFLRDPEHVRVTQKELTVPSINQVYYEVRHHQKTDALCRLLDAHDYRKMLVFCSTKRSVDEVTSVLQSRSYLADALHGNLAQTQRDRVMTRFRSGKVEILVATDVAARGLDVDDVDAVVNFDIPHDVENYVHRIGRTGRAGRSGSAFTFVAPRDHFKLRDIIRYTKAKIVASRLPSLQDVTTLRTNKMFDQLRQTIETGGLERQVALVETFLEEDYTSLDIAAALLKLHMQSNFGHESDAQRDIFAAPHREQRSHRPGGERKERFRETRDNKHKTRIQGDITRLFINIGKNMRVEPRDLVGAIAGETGVPGRSIGAIEIHDRFSFVDVPRQLADTIIQGMNGCQIRGFHVAIEKAQPKH